METISRDNYCANYMKLHDPSKSTNTVCVRPKNVDFDEFFLHDEWRTSIILDYFLYNEDSTLLEIKETEEDGHHLKNILKASVLN